MDFAFDEAQEELRETARAFLREHAGPEDVRRAMEGELGHDPEVWKRIGAELGWPSVHVPEEYGGLGLGTVELAALLETMGEAPLCSPFFASVCLGANALLVAGNEEQKQRWLPGLAEGHAIATLACAGAAGGSGSRWEPAAVDATWRRDGTDSVLSGVSRFVVDGHCADLVVVAARAEGSSGDDGISLFVVPADSAGLARRAVPGMDQTRRLAELRFEGVRVPADAILGPQGEAAPLLRKTVQLACIALAAEQVGGAQRCLDLSVAYANEREQFGRPIGSFQAIKHKCADMMVMVESARSAAYYAACVAAGDGDELPVLASLAKATCSDAYFHCAANAIQVHGGVGFTWEYDTHIHFKRARGAEQLLGSPSHHRELVARHIGL